MSKSRKKVLRKMSKLFMYGTSLEGIEQLILAVFFFAKLGLVYFDYRKHGQFEWAAPAILFACLVFTITAPLYIWTILG